MPKRNNPGCYCCDPYGPNIGDCTIACVDEENTTATLLQVEWEVTIPDTLDWWITREFFSTPFRFAYERVRGTGFSVFSGTYISEPPANEGCNFSRIQETAEIPFTLRKYSKANWTEWPPSVCGDTCPIERQDEIQTCSIEMVLVVTRTSVSLGSYVWWQAPNACPALESCRPGGLVIRPSFFIQVEENFCTEQTLTVNFPYTLGPAMCDLYEYNQVVATYRPTVI